jgi:hypothetical protein
MSDRWKFCDNDDFGRFRTDQLSPIHTLPEAETTMAGLPDTPYRRHGP